MIKIIKTALYSRCLQNTYIIELFFVEAVDQENYATTNLFSKEVDVAFQFHRIPQYIVLRYKIIYAQEMHDYLQWKFYYLFEHYAS